MYYTYVLQSLKNGRKYIGNTKDLKKRVKEHSAGSGGQYTKKTGPYRLIYYEAYIHKKDATQSELFYKTGYGREILNGKLKNYLQTYEKDS